MDFEKPGKRAETRLKLNNKEGVLTKQEWFSGNRLPINDNLSPEQLRTALKEQMRWSTESVQRLRIWCAESDAVLDKRIQLFAKEPARVQELQVLGAEVAAFQKKLDVFEVLLENTEQQMDVPGANDAALLAELVEEGDHIHNAFTDLDRKLFEGGEA